MTRIISLIGYSIAYLLNKTLRVKEVRAEFWKDIPGPVIFAFLHGEQFILYHHHRRQKIAIMTSLSRDGEIQSNIIKRFGYSPVRGSSTFGGQRALVEMIRKVRQGFSSAFAVDGPKGPIYQVKPGIILLAQKTGRPIVPISVAVKNYWLLSRTWDRYQLPKPFSRAVVVYGQPIPVRLDDNIEEKRKFLEEKLGRLTKFSHQYYWSKDISEYLSQHPNPKILIIKPSGIGDIVHSLPVAIGLKKIFSRSELHWLVFSKFADVLRKETYLDRILLWNRQGGGKEYWRVLGDIRRQNYDVVIDLQFLQRTAILAYFSGAHWKLAPALVREAAALWLKPINRFNPGLHAVERNYQVVEYIARQVFRPSPEELLPWLHPTDEEKLLAKNLIGETKNLVLFGVGSRGPHKIWPAEYYEELINRLVRDYGITPVFVGTGEEERLVSQITRRITGRYLNLVGKTDLRTLIAVIDGCSVIIGNDSAIIHLAAALDKPTLGIFGATNPRWFYPYNQKSTYIYKGYPCSPCGIKTRCRDFKCMKDISVEEVYSCWQKNFVRFLSA